MASDAKHVSGSLLLANVQRQIETDYVLQKRNLVIDRPQWMYHLWLFVSW